MLWNSKPYEERLMPIVHQAEAVGMQLVSAAWWTLPVYRFEVVYRVSQGRAPDLMEEFILQALESKFHMPVTQRFLSDAMGMDPVFVRTSLRALEKEKILEEGEDGTIELTPMGHIFSRVGRIPSGQREERIEFYFERKFGRFYLEPIQGEAWEYRKLSYLLDLVPDQQKFIGRRLLLQVAEEKGVPIEREKEGQLITSVRSAKVIGESETLFAEVWLYDLVNEKLVCRVWDQAKGNFFPEMEQYVMKNTGVEEILQEPYEQYLSYLYKTQVLSPYYNLVRDACAAARFDSKSKEEAKLEAYTVLETNEAMVRAEKALERATDRVVLLMPWLSSEAVDEKFLEQLHCLLSRQVQVSIYWGCGRTEEESVYTPEAAERLSSLEGELTVQFSGHVKEKELIIDDTLLLRGCANWYAYYGDYHLREAVFAVTDQEEIRREILRWTKEGGDKDGFEQGNIGGAEGAFVSGT